MSSLRTVYDTVYERIYDKFRRLCFKVTLLAVTLLFKIEL